MTKLTASRSPSERVCAVRRADLRHRPAAAEQRRDVAVARRLLDRPRDEVLHVREAREVRVDVGLRLLARDLEVLREAERRDAVDDPEVDHLRDRALAGRQLGRVRRRAPRRRSRGGCPRRARTPRAASARPRRARGCAARSASSRPTSASSPPRR